MPCSWGQVPVTRPAQTRALGEGKGHSGPVSSAAKTKALLPGGRRHSTLPTQSQNPTGHCARPLAPRRVPGQALGGPSGQLLVGVANPTSIPRCPQLSAVLKHTQDMPEPFFFFGHIYGMQKVSGQGSNPRLSRDNTESLTIRPTRELHEYSNCFTSPTR